MHKSIVKNKDEYVKRRLSGEEVVSIASVYGYNAMELYGSDGKLVVIEVNRNNLSYYEYLVSAKQFCVKYNKDNICHSIAEVLDASVTYNQKIENWWKCVFYDDSGVICYDEEYDTLPIAEACEVKFSGLISKLFKHLQSLNLPVAKSPVYIVGELSSNPMLQYVLQQVISAQTITKLTQINSFTESEHDIILFPIERLKQIELRVNRSIKLNTLVASPVNITLPLDSSLNAEMMLKTKWNDILFNNEPDYSVGNMKFKRISLWVECDVYNNIFVYGKDMHGHNKVIKIN